MPRQYLALVLVDHGESHLGLSRLHNDVTSASGDHEPGAFFHPCNQCHVVDEVGVQEERDFRLGEAASYGKETAVKRLAAAAADGCEEVGSVVGSERADFVSRSASIAEYLAAANMDVTLNHPYGG